MISTYLTLLAGILVIIFITHSSKFRVNGSHKKSVKESQGEEITKLDGFRVILEVIRMLYYQYIEGIPYYEMAQRLMARAGNVIYHKFPFRSMEYQLIGDPVYAKRIMSDPSWPDRAPLGYYIQDAGFYKPNGLLFGGGKSYKPASRVMAKLLHQLGFFNATTIEGHSVLEMEELERKLDANMALNCGEHTFSPRDIFGRSSMNIVLHILLGKTKPFGETVTTKLVSEIAAMNKKLAAFASVLEVVPFLRHFPKLTFLKYFNATAAMIYDVLREVIGEKRRLGKYKEHVEDFVDGMLQQVDKNEGNEDGLNEENMLVVLRDMLIAGSDTTSATLEHAFFIHVKSSTSSRESSG